MEQDMISKCKWMFAVMAAAVFTAPAGAQWRATAIGVAEVDTESSLFLLGGISASPGGSRGIAPLIGLQAYHVGFDNGSSRTSVFTAKPYVGLTSGYGAGSVYGTVGYAFSNRDEGTLIRTTSTNDIGDGVVVAGGWDHWGSGGPWGHQLLGSYNFDSENFWGRGRVTRRISQSGAAQRRFGVEAALLTGDGYSAWQPGAIMEFHNGRGHILGLGVGAKLPDEGDNAIYFKVEGVLPIRR
jgi:hypothetical protein